MDACPGPPEVGGDMDTGIQQHVSRFPQQNAMGFDPALFLAPPSSDFLCAICSAVLEKPLACTEGHTFCAACLHQWLQAHETCPTCRTVVSPESLSKSRPLQNLIQTLAVQCPHAHKEPADCPEVHCSPPPPPPHEGRPPTDWPTEWSDRDCSDAPPAKRRRGADGCGWQGPLSGLDAHLESCGFVPVACPDAGCGARLRRRDLPGHRPRCEFRPVKCLWCGARLQFRGLCAHVRMACPQVHVPCPHLCGRSLPRAQLPAHLDRDCPLEPVDCAFRGQGCTARRRRGDEQQHLRDAALEHAALGVRALQALRAETAAEIAGLKALVGRLQAQCVQLQDRCDREEAKVKFHWRVEGVAGLRAARRTVCSQKFLLAGFELVLKFEFDRPSDGESTLWLSPFRSGEGVPLSVRGTTLTLKSQTRAPNSITRVLNMSSPAGYHGAGFDFSKEEIDGLCHRDALHIEGTLLAKKRGTLVLRTREGSADESDSDVRIVPPPAGMD